MAMPNMKDALICELDQTTARLQAENIQLRRAVQNKTDFIGMSTQAVNEKNKQLQLMHKRGYELDATTRNLEEQAATLDRDDATLELMIKRVEGAIHEQRDKNCHAGEHVRSLVEQVSQGLKQYTEAFADINVAVDDDDNVGEEHACDTGDGDRAIEASMLVEKGGYDDDNKNKKAAMY